MLRNLLLLMLIMNGLAFHNTKYANNVGTVLFSTSDVGKTRWNTDDIGLLKARCYFQNLLPPPLFVSTLNENYVDLLFSYFREAYSAIKRETDDPNMDRTMTAALSDSIGGYLKAWVLPVTKFAFYVGTISEQNVTTLFEFYDEIKRYLRTDGDGWHRPKTNLFDVSIKTADRKLTTSAVGNSADPCDHFVLFEKTPEGLNVPIPHVSWDGASSKIFLPFKNHSIYAMNSTNSSLVLLKYYETAKYCLQLRYPSMLNNFDARFQSWLANEVLPHLGDDGVYLALGSVLTVMNTTRNLYDNVINMYEHNPKPCKKVHTFAFSKKMMIVTLLIFIEVVWCCIALIYTCYAKRKKSRASQCFLFVQPRHPDHQDKSHNTNEECGRKPFGIKVNVIPKREQAVQNDVNTLFVRGQSRDKECCACPSTPSTVTHSTETITGDSSNASYPKIHNKKASKRNSLHPACSCPISTSSTTAISSSKTIISNRHIRHDNDKRVDKKEKHVKHFGCQKIEMAHAVTETRKSKQDITAPSSKRELKSSEYRHSQRNKGSEALRSKVFPDVTKIVQVEIPSKEKSIDTTEFLKSVYFCQTTGTQNAPLPNSSKNLNTDLSINNHMKHEQSQCYQPVKTSIYSTNTENMKKNVSFSNEASKPESYAEFIADIPDVKLELVKKETLIIETPKYMEEKESVVKRNYTTRSDNYSLHSVETRKTSRNVSSRKQDFTIYPSEQKLKNKDCKELKSKSFAKIGSKVSSSKHSKKLQPFVEEAIPSSSTVKKRRPAKLDTETKSPRLSIQKEFKDIKHIKEPYWEITIDEPQKDVYVDIKGTILIDSKNVKRSRIPKLTVRTVEPRAASTTPRTTRARSLIPQLKKKAVLKTDQINKLNTSI